MPLPIQHLKEERCVTCGAAPVAEEITGQHCNGEQFESRKFKCGRSIRWVPNFSRAEVVVLCSSDQIKIASDKRRKTIAEGLLKEAKRLGMTDEELENFTRHFQYGHW